MKALSFFAWTSPLNLTAEMQNAHRVCKTGTRKQAASYWKHEHLSSACWQHHKLSQSDLPKRPCGSWTCFQEPFLYVSGGEILWCGWKMLMNGRAMLWEPLHFTMRTAMTADGHIRVIMKICLLSRNCTNNTALIWDGFVNSVIMSLWVISSILRNLFPITMLIKTQLQVIC